MHRTWIIEVDTPFGTMYQVRTMFGYEMEDTFKTREKARVRQIELEQEFRRDSVPCPTCGDELFCDE